MRLPSRNPSSGERGFTFLELLVAMSIMVVVMVLSMSLLFGMKLFAQRQQRFAEPRQTARRALDYIASYARTATDMDPVMNNPNSLIMWYRNAAGLVQSSYNNFTAMQAALGNEGTDAITMAHVVDPARVHFSTWNGPGDFANASNSWLEFRDGCDGSASQNANNMRLFMELTGCHGDPGCNTGTFPCPGCQSEVLTVMDESGGYAYFQITGYQDCNCDGAVDADSGYRNIIHVTNTPGGSDGINPPSYKGVAMPASIAGGLLYYTFRVKTPPGGDVGQLQQKQGFLNPADPDAGFVPLLDNVEDFQVAYIYNNGEIRNAPGTTLGTVGTVPEQIGQVGVAGPYDIINVRAMRLTIVARSPVEAPGYTNVKFRAPTVEDSPLVIPNDRFYHHRISATIMLRNRVRGG